MGDAAAQEQAAKSRIVNHMNKDHHDSVVRYLQHYGKLSAFNAYTGRMTDVDLDGMTLSCQGRTHRVPFKPSLSSYKEARERVVELDRECRKALGQTDVTVKRYVPPITHLIYIIESTVIASTFAAYSQRWWFAIGGPVERILGSSFATFSWRIQPWLITAMITIHGIEALYFGLVKLRAHSVNPRSPVWWLWFLSSFLEGQFAYRRFDDLVKSQREAQKH